MTKHPLSDVQTKNIGEGTIIWQYAVILPNAIIGKNCNINCHTFIENDVIIGDNVTVKSGTYIWDATRIEDDVLIGPAVVFTNDIRPRSKKKVVYPITTIKKGTSIGAASTILAGITIGEYAMTGIGSVITKDVPSHALVYGNPARIHGWVDKKGCKLKQLSDEDWEDEDGAKYKIINSELTSL